MTLDHTSFVTQHHKGVRDPLSPALPGGRRPLTLWLVGLLTLTYVLFFILLGLVMEMDQTVIIIGLTVFALCFVAAFVVSRIIHVMSAHERDRAVLQSIFDTSRVGRLVTDSKDRVVYCNPVFRGYCGVAEPGLPAVQEMFSCNPESASLISAIADQARRGLTDAVELELCGGDEGRTIKVSAKPIEGWPGYLHWQLEETTLLRAQDREILEERSKLIDFTDNAPVGFFSVDEDGRFVFANATLARWLGADINDLTSEGRLHDYLVDPATGMAPYDILPEGGARQVGEVRMKGGSGRIFLAAVNQTVVHEGGSRVRTRGVVNDLTSERRMRQALKASEDRFQRFFEEAPLGIALVDSARTIKDCNHALAHMLGQGAAEVEGRVFDTLLDDDQKTTVLEALQSIVQGQPMPPVEVRLRGAKGNVPVQLHARKFKDKDEIVLHLIDLSRQKTLEAQFVQSQKMQAIGQLAGGVAHDFNNLLTAMIGFCDLLLLRHKPGDPSFADINQIKQNANRAANLVRQLLAFSRQQTLRPKVQDITDILIELSHLLRRLLGANIELSVVHGQDLGLVKVDEGQMEQVLINLAVNARDAMPEGGKLLIETGVFHSDAPVQRGAEVMPAGDWVTIAVSDTGTGMPADVMARIFEPFFTTKPVGQGTGLGLSTVYGIMRQTGGFVHVDSALGKGTTFTLYLPRHSAAESEVLPASAPADDLPKPQDLTGSATILLVEDEDAVRSFSTRALTNKGYRVIAAASGEDALAQFKNDGTPWIDLMITDVVMPGIDGPTLAKSLRELSPELRIIFISGYTEDRLKDYMGPGIFFLPKPFTLKQLAEKVKDVLAVSS